MSSTNEKYIAFVKERLKKSNYRAMEKLMRIDELAEVIFTARKNYRKSKEQKSETKTKEQ